jgi:hypothetical protein
LKRWQRPVLSISCLTALRFSRIFQMMIAVADEGRRGCAVMKEQATTAAGAVTAYRQTPLGSDAPRSPPQLAPAR